MDSALESRAVTGNASRTSTVIVTLAAGTDVPAALLKYSRYGRLNGIGGHVLDIPDSELKNVATLAQNGSRAPSIRRSTASISASDATSGASLLHRTQHRL